MRFSLLSGFRFFAVLAVVAMLGHGCGQSQQIGPKNPIQGDIIRQPDGVSIKYFPTRPKHDCDDQTLPDWGSCRQFDDTVHVCSPEPFSCLDAIRLESSDQVLVEEFNIPGESLWDGNIFLKYDNLSSVHDLAFVAEGCDGQWRIDLPLVQVPDLALSDFSHDETELHARVQIEGDADGIYASTSGGLAGYECMSDDLDSFNVPILQTDHKYLVGAKAMVQIGTIDNDLGSFALLQAGEFALYEIELPWPREDERLEIEVDVFLTLTLGGSVLNGEGWGVATCMPGGTEPTIEATVDLFSVEGTEVGSIMLGVVGQSPEVRLFLEDDLFSSGLPRATIVDPLRIGSNGLEDFVFDYGEINLTDLNHPGQSVLMQLLLTGKTKAWISKPRLE